MVHPAFPLHTGIEHYQGLYDAQPPPEKPSLGEPRGAQTPAPGQPARPGVATGDGGVETGNPGIAPRFARMCATVAAVLPFVCGGWMYCAMRWVVFGRQGHTPT
jgi:hypothetical protein